MNNTYFYKDKSLFGLDIGFKTIKVMQLGGSGNSQYVTGYGVVGFDELSVRNGVIVDFEKLASCIQNLFSGGLVGEITTRRAAFSVPASRTFARILTLPLLANKDISEAVRLEAEQYIPVSIDELYIDYSIIKKTKKDMEVLAVAVPKKIVDSYIQLAKILGLEAVVMEPTTSSTDRLFRKTEQHSVPTVLVDFGSVSADISLYDDGLAVTGTVPGGGDDLNRLIADKLNVTKEEAHNIKLKYGFGVSKKQKEIVEAATPQLQKTIHEIKRIIRYYEERSKGHGKIEQIVTFGGGANIPGLSEFLIDNLRLPVRACDPWNSITFKHIKPPSPVEQSMYITAASLSLIEPKEIFG